MRILFFGTPAFAVPSLTQLINSRHPVVAAVTPPDRPRGRSSESSPQVRDCALSAKIPIFQPHSLKDPAFLETVASCRAELAVVVAFGSLLPVALLELFPKGAINLHASLLPKFRGAAPIPWALIQGEAETGVTVFQIDEKLDHGPILLQARRSIQPQDTAVTLGEALAELGCRTLLQAVDRIETGSAVWVPQNDPHATPAPRLSKADGIIDWSLPCDRICNRVRGVQPWPGATTWIAGLRGREGPKRLLKLASAIPDASRHDPNVPPGTVVTADADHGLWVQTGRGQVRIDRLQLEGGTMMESATFLRGHPIRPGTFLTTPV